MEGVILRCARLETALGEFEQLRVQYTSTSESLQGVSADMAHVLVDSAKWIITRLEEEIRGVADTCTDADIAKLLELLQRCRALFEQLGEWASTYGPVRRVARRVRRGLAYTTGVLREVASFVYRYKFGIAYSFLIGFASYRIYQSGSTGAVDALMRMNVNDIGMYSALSAVFGTLCPLLEDDACVVAACGLYVVATVQHEYYEARRGFWESAARHSGIRRWAGENRLDPSTLDEIDQAFGHAADQMVAYAGSNVQKAVGELDIILYGLRTLLSNQRISLAIFLLLAPGFATAWRMLAHLACTASYGAVRAVDAYTAAWSTLQRAIAYFSTASGPAYASVRLTNDTPFEQVFAAPSLFIDGKWHTGELTHTSDESVQTLYDLLRGGSLVKWVSLGAGGLLLLHAIDKLRVDDLRIDLESEVRDAPRSERLERAVRAMEQTVANLPRYSAGSPRLRWPSQWRAAHLPPTGL